MRLKSTALGLDPGPDWIPACTGLSIVSRKLGLFFHGTRAFTSGHDTNPVIPARNRLSTSFLNPNLTAANHNAIGEGVPIVDLADLEIPGSSSSRRDDELLAIR